MTIYALDGVEPSLHDTAWVAPSADVMGKVEMAENSSVWFCAVLRGDNDLIKIGKNSNIQDNSVLHTCLLYTSPSPRDATLSRMPSSA